MDPTSLQSVASDLLMILLIKSAHFVVAATAVLLFSSHLLGFTFLPSVTAALNDLLGLGNE